MQTSFWYIKVDIYLLNYWKYNEIYENNIYRKLNRLSKTPVIIYKCIVFRPIANMYIKQWQIVNYLSVKNTNGFVI